MKYIFTRETKAYIRKVTDKKYQEVKIKVLWSSKSPSFVDFFVENKNKNVFEKFVISSREITNFYENKEQDFVSNVIIRRSNYFENKDNNVVEVYFADNKIIFGFSFIENIVYHIKNNENDIDVFVEEYNRMFG